MNQDNPVNTTTPTESDGHRCAACDGQGHIVLVHEDEDEAGIGHSIDCAQCNGQGWIFLPPSTPPTRALRCEWSEECADPVTHLDNKGFVYCTGHGLERRGRRPCRKLRPHELRRLERGEPVKRY